MKFSVLRNKERKEKKNLEKLLKRLSSLNPKGNFRAKQDITSHICSDLSLDDLSSLSLPIDASFGSNPMRTAKEYGFVLINYKNKEYSIFGKGFEGPYLLV